jgi:heme-degrading monooxygenase HmoA
MFARVIEIKTKAGKAPDLCHAIHDKVLSVLKAQPGFVDEIVLISETEEDKVLAISFWKTREDEQKYSAEHAKQVAEIVKNEIHAAPTVHRFLVDSSTAHKIAKAAGK